ALLLLVHLFGLELLPLTLLGFAVFLTCALWPQAFALAIGIALVHLVVHFLVAEHGGISCFRSVRTLRVFRNHCVESRAALFPTLSEIEQVSHRVADFLQRWPVLFNDARELE